METLPPCNRRSTPSLVLFRSLSPSTSSQLRRRCNTDVLDQSDSDVVRIDFALLLGRRFVSFGSSRACEVQLTDDHLVSLEQFKIHLDIYTGALLLTDTSDTGTRVISGTSQSLIHRATLPLIDGAVFELNFGSSHRFHVFVLRQNPALFRRSFLRYARSLQASTPFVHSLARIEAEKCTLCAAVPRVLVQSTISQRKRRKLKILDAGLRNSPKRLLATYVSGKGYNQGWSVTQIFAKALSMAKRNVLIILAKQQ